MCVLWLYPKFWIPIVYTVQSHYRFAVDFHLMHMSLPRLERLTLRANLMFLQLIKSCPPLKQLSLGFRYSFFIIAALAMSTLSLVPMTSGSLSFLLQLNAKICMGYRTGQLPFRQNPFFDCWKCPRLMHVVEQGVVVVKARVSNGNEYESQDPDGLSSFE